MSSKLRLALIQSQLIWENPAQNLANFSDKISTITEDVDLIVLPEMFTTGFTMSPQNFSISEGEKTLKWMQTLARDKKAAIVGSLPFHENGNFTNRLFFVKPDGTYHQYDKRHTFTLASEDKVYKSGSERLVVEYRGFRICPMVCYDLRFPVWARNKDDYDVLLYAANWPEPRIAAWDCLLKARAIENLAYCIGVNRIGTDGNSLKYPGHSAVYNCLGERISYSEKEEIVYATISKEHIASTRENLKFLADKDDFSLRL